MSAAANAIHDYLDATSGARAAVAPGIHYGMSMAEYLAIPALSAGVITTLLDRCPAAAWYESPWNPRRASSSTAEQDAGSIAHSIFLEGSRDVCEVIDPNDHPAEKTGNIPDGWTNKSIKAARDAARAAGKIPVLKPAMAEIEAISAAARTYVDSLRESEPAIHALFEPAGGTSETVLIWQEGATLCKLRADRLATDFALIADYKTTGVSAEPMRFGRAQLVGLRYYVSASWYRRGVRAVTGVDPTYIFLAGETDAPYLHSLIGCDPSLAELGDEKVGAGLAAWQECQRANHWPAYPNRVCWIEAPVYEVNAWAEREGIDAHGIPYDISKLFARKAA